MKYSLHCVFTFPFNNKSFQEPWRLMCNNKQIIRRPRTEKIDLILMCQSSTFALTYLSGIFPKDIVELINLWWFIRCWVWLLHCYSSVVLIDRDNVFSAIWLKRANSNHDSHVLNLIVRFWFLKFNKIRLRLRKQIRNCKNNFRKVVKP